MTPVAHEHGARPSTPAPTPSSTRSTARPCAPSASRATATSSAAARTAAPPARSAASSSPASAPSARACAASRPSPARPPRPSPRSASASSRRPWPPPGAQTAEQLAARIEELKERGEGDARGGAGLVPTRPGGGARAELLQQGALVAYTGGFRSMDELKAWARRCAAAGQRRHRGRPRGRRAAAALRDRQRRPRGRRASTPPTLVRDGRHRERRQGRRSPGDGPGPAARAGGRSQASLAEAA